MPQYTADSVGARLFAHPLARRAAALLGAVVMLASNAGTALEALDNFPRTMVDIRTKSGHLWFDVAIANTEDRSEQGLMFVRSMPGDQGMLFPEAQPRVMSMWMKNTLIPLDMLFIDTKGRIACLLERVPPLTLDIRTCSTPVKAVLELNGGEAERRGIRVADLASYSLPAP
jgi:uncharacterized membrane protein (UPF0127 family)